MTAEHRDRILDAAARVFAARGYHRASVEAICSDAGVELYELEAEFPDKYVLFATTVLRVTETTVRASDHATATPADSRQARAQISAVIEATARITISQRNASGFYRAEVRKLRPDDRARHRALIIEIQERIRRPLAIMRPSLSAEEIALLAAAAHSVIASITIHPTTLPEAKMLTLLTTAAMRVIDSTPATAADTIEGPDFAPPWRSDDSLKWRIHSVGIALFAERGFDEVTIDDIAAAAGVNVETVEQECGSPYDMLYEGCRIGHQAINEANLQAVELPHPRQALVTLCHIYVHYSFEEPEGMTVFLSDGRRLEGTQLADMLRMQTETVGHWVRSLLAARPELSAPEASFLVFAGLSIVNDVGRALGWQRGELTEARIERVVLAAMANLRH